MPTFSVTPELPVAVLDILPNPVLVKDEQLRYVWANQAFEQLFGVPRSELIGRLDKEVFRQRQAAQCNGGDLRVLESGDIDEAYETVFKDTQEPREMITRKSRLALGDRVFLVGVMHDITDVTLYNRKLEEQKVLLKEQSRELHRAANEDVLTGCMNRRALFEEAASQFAKFDNAGALLLLDLDFFKAINDAYGHGGGDAALVHFVDVTRKSIRDSDRLARIGGEEFAVLLPGASEEEANVIAGRICEELRTSSLEFKGNELRLTVSIGAVLKSDPSPMDLDDWLPVADRYLYEAKRSGRDRVVFGRADVPRSRPPQPTSQTPSGHVSRRFTSPPT
ncbi:MAG: hypothetical protein RJA70_1986 [Pseudomonadota bacterium]|jgi:diguanylate cyclase (GGDEF)-like protein/PAS domain S-box-containing protein